MQTSGLSKISNLFYSYVCTHKDIFVISKQIKDKDKGNQTCLYLEERKDININQFLVNFQKSPERIMKIHLNYHLELARI